MAFCMERLFYFYTMFYCNIKHQTDVFDILHGNWFENYKASCLIALGIYWAPAIAGGAK